MKLPECYWPIARHQLFSAKEVEAIVRDCAKVRIKLGGGGEELLPSIWQDAILARYGLEPKP